jgi:hypothetical protein
MHYYPFIPKIKNLVKKHQCLRPFQLSISDLPEPVYNDFLRPETISSESATDVSPIDKKAIN